MFYVMAFFFSLIRGFNENELQLRYPIVTQL